MSWLRIDDGFTENTKVEPLSDRAFRIHVAGLAHCARNLTDGHVSSKALKALLARLSGTRKHVSELEDAALWLRAGDGHMLKDYLEYNPSGDDVKTERKKNADRQKKWRETNRGEDGRFQSNGVRNALRNGLRNAAPAPPGLKASQMPFAHANESKSKPRYRRDLKPLDFAAEGERMMALRPEMND